MKCNFAKGADTVAPTRFTETTHSISEWACMFWGWCVATLGGYLVGLHITYKVLVGMIALDWITAWGRRSE